MPSALIVEDGTGKTDSNTYISLAGADAYFGDRPFSTKWTSASEANRNAALLYGTKTLDRAIRWNGYKANDDQALQWPRIGVSNPNLPDTDFSEEEIPREIIDAQCEMAISLLTKDRMADPQGEGIKSFELVDVMKTEFDSMTTAPVIPSNIMAMLSPFGTAYGKSGSVPAIRT